MQVTDELIRSVVLEVLAHVGNGQTRAWGVYQDVDTAIKAAVAAQREFELRGLEDRRKAVECIRRICKEQAEALGREELEETKIGRLPHKVEKLQVIADRIPGVEFLKTEAYSGE